MWITTHCAATPDGIRQSLAGLQAIYGTQDWILVTGVSVDKKCSQLTRALNWSPPFDTIICTAAHHKGADARDIAEATHIANPQASIQIAVAIEDAVALSRSQATAQNRKVYVAGGLFLAIEYAVVARGGRAGELTFF